MFTQVRKAAQVASDTARREAFRMLAREHNGVNARNRASIEAQANEAAKHAALAVFYKAGYRDCITQCGRLASPGYLECPNH